QKLSAELQRVEQEARQLVNTRQQTIHWQQVIEHAESFRQLLGNNLERLSFEERQAVAQCLIHKVVVTAEDIDIHFVLPFQSPPQVSNRPEKEPEGAPGHFYRLRLADSSNSQRAVLLAHYYAIVFGASYVTAQSPVAIVQAYCCATTILGDRPIRRSLVAI